MNLNLSKDKKTCIASRILEKWRVNISGYRTDITPVERETQKNWEYNLYEALKEIILEDL